MFNSKLNIFLNLSKANVATGDRVKPLSSDSCHGLLRHGIGNQTSAEKAGWSAISFVLGRVRVNYKSVDWGMVAIIFLCLNQARLVSNGTGSIDIDYDFSVYDSNILIEKSIENFMMIFFESIFSLF